MKCQVDNVDFNFIRILENFVCEIWSHGLVLGFNVGKLDGGYGCYMGWVQGSLVAMGKTFCN